ncbi:MAG: hypothetical protein GX025_06660 [Clostridiales bacterium]|nr:hypothetical protein [Clostridiales bacterium]
MQTITNEYTVLFNTITDVSRSLKLIEEKLKFAQQQAEDIYIERAQSGFGGNQIEEA